MASLKRIPAIFFRTAAGRETVRDWLRTLPVADRKAIGDDIRTRLPSRRIARTIFFVSDRGFLVLLHGFIKKTQKLAPADLALAKANRDRYEESDR